MGRRLEASNGKGFRQTCDWIADVNFLIVYKEESNCQFT